MKELSIEEKARNYDEALKVLHKYDGANIMFSQSLKEEMFPELKESEDERIRKAIIEIVKKDEERIGVNAHLRKIQWLEKQGKNNMGISEATKQKLEDNLNKALEKETPESWNEFLEKQSELDKDSEDEKIRQFLIHEVAETSDKVMSYRNMNKKDVLAWLEKQGEQKPVPKFKVGDTMRTLQEATNGYTDGMPVVVSIDEEYYHCNNELIAIKDQDDYEYPPMNRRQKPADLPKGEDYGIDSLYHAARILEKTLGEVDGYESDDGILEHKCAIEAVNRLYKQKPAWSEEDERMYRGLHNLIYSTPYCDSRKEFSDWLKFLKDRVQPKQKQEWSEEDERTYRSVLYAFEHRFPLNCVQQEFVKSLRERYTWKPSEE